MNKRAIKFGPTSTESPTSYFIIHAKRGFFMNTKILMSVAAAALITLTGCSTNPTNAQIGTGVGAVAGGLVGNAVLGGTLGTVGGAAAGALIGNEVGKKK